MSFLSISSMKFLYSICTPGPEFQEISHLLKPANNASYSELMAFLGKLKRIGKENSSERNLELREESKIE